MGSGGVDGGLALKVTLPPTLHELQERAPVLLIFLRHFG
jgi:hypothetical protein